MKIKILVIGFIFYYSYLLCGSINGFIIDNVKEPLIGANVMITDSDIGTTSNTEGYFLIDGLAPGKYTIKANYIGFYEESVDFYISENEIVSEQTSDYSEKFLFRKRKIVLAINEKKNFYIIINFFFKYNLCGYSKKIFIFKK